MNTYRSKSDLSGSAGLIEFINSNGKNTEVFKNNPMQSKSVLESALIEVANFYGYQVLGMETLKSLFNETNKGIFGLYWDGEEWVVNEIQGSDDECGSSTGQATIDNIIKSITTHGGYIFELIDMGEIKFLPGQDVNEATRNFMKGQADLLR